MKKYMIGCSPKILRNITVPKGTRLYRSETKNIAPGTALAQIYTYYIDTEKTTQKDYEKTIYTCTPTDGQVPYPSYMIYIEEEGAYVRELDIRNQENNKLKETKSNTIIIILVAALLILVWIIYKFYLNK